MHNNIEHELERWFADALDAGFLATELTAYLARHDVVIPPNDSKQLRGGLDIRAARPESLPDS